LFVGDVAPELGINFGDPMAEIDPLGIPAVRTIFGTELRAEKSRVPFVAAAWRFNTVTCS
jgi:hypothetical protein